MCVSVSGWLCVGACECVGGGGAGGGGRVGGGGEREHGRQTAMAQNRPVQRGGNL